MDVTLGEAVGGPRLLDRRLLAIVLPPALVTSVLTRDPDDVRTALAWIGVNLASLMLVWLWVELLRATVVARRRTEAAALGLVVLLGASIGFVKGTTTSLFAWTAGLAPMLMPTAEWWRAVSTTAQGAFLLPALTLVAATLDRYRDEYERLVTARARAALLAQGRDARTGSGDERSELIVGFVEEARRRLSAAGDRPMANVLDRLVEERLRPMTHELWSPERIGTDFRVRSLLRSALVTNPFPILPVATLYAVTGFASRAQDIAAGVNLARTSASVVVIVAVFSLARRLRPAGTRWATLHLAVTLTTVAALHTFVIETLGPEGPRWRTGTLLMTLLVWIVFLTVLSGAAIVALRGGDRMREELQRRLERDRTDGTEGVVARASQRLRDREVADHLHSSLQNRLIAASHRIAASGEHEHVVREELDAIELLLADLAAGATGPTAADAGVRGQLADIVARWDGFVTITSQLDPMLDGLDPSVQARIAQVLAEAVNNAVRHGRAATVHVRLELRDGPRSGDDVIALTVEDDGVGPVLRGPGLGSALFDTMSDGDWTLEARAEGGSRLRMSIAADVDA